jgi:hypothetical protein
MLQRLIERFELWREEKAEEKRDANPLNCQRSSQHC